MRKIYIESTIPSYYTAKPSKIPKTHERQILTKKFWSYAVDFFDLYISTMVLMEIKRGDPEVAEARRLAILPFKLIQVSENDNELAEVYINFFLPKIIIN